MFDAFTAKTMLQNVNSSNVDQMADLYKSLNNNSAGGPTEEARAFFEQNKGKACKIRYTDHEGIVLRLNEATAGFYPGSVFPIHVEITNGENKGTIFEYGLEQVEIVGN